MKSHEIYEELRRYLEDAGFNLLVKIKSSEYDAEAAGKKSSSDFLEDAKSIILSGFAGNGFWKAFKRFLDNNPGFKEKHENPIDSYSRLIFGRLPEILQAEDGIRYELVFPFGDAATDMDFVKLGMLGGVGVPSLLGILLNPKYGTWISMRGALVTDIEFGEYDKPLSSFDPCSGCYKPCITSCPARTLSENGWDWQACMRFRMSDDTCSEKCSSRIACPYGKEHAYSAEQIEHHHAFVLKSVREYFTVGENK
jgi:epoxyqueuosine reductase